MMKKQTFIAWITAGLLLAFSFNSALAAGGATPPPKLKWSFHGPFGNFDRAQMKRGWQVYKEVCAGCHSLHQIYYRNLQAVSYTHLTLPTKA